MARPRAKSQAPSSSHVDRAGLGLPVSLELVTVGLDGHQREERKNVGREGECGKKREKKKEEEEEKWR